MVGNGDAMSVAGQIAQDMLGTTEGRFEIDHPVLPEQGTQEGGKGSILAKRLQGSRENELGVACFQAGDELATEDAAEHVARH